MTKNSATPLRLIESDTFPFEFLSHLAERESWRKELHRPVYHVHKWWANRLGSVFRGILLGCVLPEEGNLQSEFYRSHEFSQFTVFDPFMGSGTTVGEAHKLGLTALGRDINPVAVQAVSTALGSIDRRSLVDAFDDLSNVVGKQLRSLYRSTDSKGRQCDVLYNFWVMQAACPECEAVLDLFRSYVIARNAYPRRRPDVQILCPECGDIFPGLIGQTEAKCRACDATFDPTQGTTQGRYAKCPDCRCQFSIRDAIARRNSRPAFRLYGKLVLTESGKKEYVAASELDHAAYAQCAKELQRELAAGNVRLPEMELKDGYNTRQAMGYGFCAWRDFFNDRQLLALARLRRGIEQLSDQNARSALLTLFSGALEFNNLFASYKGEGTGAVRHMFSHHILKPERTPIEANLWGTTKSSGSFSGLFRSRLLRALDYREAPTELNGKHGTPRVCSSPFSGRIEPEWPKRKKFTPRGIYLSSGDSARTGLPAQSVDLVVTDPPFFDNVHYSELADFFYAWHQSTTGEDCLAATTRHAGEVQDTDAARFSEKLQGVFSECSRVLKLSGLLVFTYHHSRPGGWISLAEAILGAGFRVTNAHPVKAEMSVATPKSQAKDPIQLDIIIVCRKQQASSASLPEIPEAIESARSKLQRLYEGGFRLSRNDCKIVVRGQLLTTLESAADFETIAREVEAGFDLSEFEQPLPPRENRQKQLF